METKQIYENQKEIIKFKHSIVKYQVVLIVLMAFLLLAIYLCINERKTLLNRIKTSETTIVILKEKNKVLKEINRTLFSEYNLIQELKKQGVKHIDIWLNIAKLETGNFTSDGFLKKNNLFGISYNNKLVIFDNWIEGVKFVADYERKYYKGNSDKEFYDFLKNIGYAKDINYINKLKHF